YDGKVEYNGIPYKYVKRKVANGELVLLCLPNENRMKLQNARDEFFKLVNDLQQSSHNNNSAPAGSIKNPITEYWQQENTWQLAVLTAQLHQYTSYASLMPSSPLITTPARPPEC
ncbi:MAG TPA: hypothetical protein VM187_17585, partial [Niastella sp.]|nr:hypothetical protein [Niastella sp.]